MDQTALPNGEKHMLAAVYYGPDDLRLEERPVPGIGPDEALLKVINTGICGTDLRILHGGHRKYPAGTVRVPGHEVVGEIVEVGANVTGVPVGQRVMVAPNYGCGHCPQCVTGNNNRCANYGGIGITLDGAFAEYMRIPAAMILQGDLIPIGDDVDPAAAALIEPFACVLRGQDALHIGPDDVVLVSGAGPIGTMHIMLARLKGAKRVIVSELVEARLPQAVAAGADRTVNITEENLADVIMDESNGRGADAIIIAAPAHKAQEEALSLAAIGGRINFFGGLPKDRPTITFDSNLVHYKELIVTGTTACSTSDCWRAAEIVNAGRIDLTQLVSGRYPLTEIHAAFKEAENRTALKIVVELDS
jgi:L-iditol 2-dehydrogenase